MENSDWLSDYILGILKSPTWVVPTMDFIDQKAILFDETEESTHEQMQCHRDFQELVTSLFLAHLAEVSITEEQFEAFMEVGLSSGGASVHRALAEQLLSVDDFLSFKAMMCKHNADLCREVVTVEEAVDPTSPALSGLVSDVVRSSLESGLDEWQLYDAQRWEGSGRRTSEEAEEARRKREEAELQQAIALSLSIEEERLRQLAQEEPPAALPEGVGFISAPICHLPPKPFPESAPATTLAPPRLVQVEPMKIAKKPWGFTSAPLMPRPHHAPPAPPPPPAPEPEPAAQAAPVPRLPGRAGFLSSPLCIVPPKPRVLVQPSESAPPPPPPEDSDRDCDSPKSPGSPLSPGTLAPLNHYRSNLRLWKHRASLAVEPVPEAVKEARRSRIMSDERLRADSGTSDLSQEDRLKRAEHLRRQRDLLLGKRMKERGEQLQEFTRRGDSAALSREDQAALGRRLVAELSGAPTATSQLAPEVATQMRQALTRQLLQSLASSMQSDAATLEDQLNQLETMRWT
eukprot:s141_g12.t1